MKAMILAAGFGTRLGELTVTKPKCLMDIGGLTILEHVAARAALAGVSELVINLHAHADQIEAFVAHHSLSGLAVKFSREQTIMGTGGGIRDALPHFRNETTVLVHNADVYSEIDLAAVIADHDRKRAAATLVVMERPSSRYLLFDSGMQLAGWENPDEEKLRTLRPGPHERLAFSGISVMSPALFPFIEGETGPFSIVRSWMNASQAGLPIRGYLVPSEGWVDIGTPAQLTALRSRRMSA